jgi:hypothetical protein
MNTRKTLLLLGMAPLFVLLVASSAFPQSSGNFAASVNTTQCLIDNADGSLDGGMTGTFLDTTIKTPNSSQTALLIRPSLVSGLYTKNRVSEDVPSSTVWAGLRVRVCLDDKIVAPGTPVGNSCSGNPTQGWIFFNKRWVQVSQNFINQIEACAEDPADPTTELCFLQLIISTLSAHSFDFVAGAVGGGTHTVKVEWQFEDSDSTGGNAAACVGPGVLTVTQVKTFSTGGGIEITP